MKPVDERNAEAVTGTDDSKNTHGRSEADGEEGESDSAVLLRAEVARRRRLELELAEERNRYRAVFEGANDAVFIVSRREDGLPGRFLSVNEAACRMLGYSRERLLEMSPADLDLPEYAAAIESNTRVLDSRGGHVFRAVHRAHGGRHVPVEVSARPAELDGEPVFFSFVRDVGPREAAAEEATRRQASARAALELGTEYLAEPDLFATARAALRRAEELTGSEYGFVGASYRGEEVRLLAVSENAWSAAAGGADLEAQRQALETEGQIDFPWFGDLAKALFSGSQAVIVNDVASHPFQTLLGEGHPPLRRFVAAPLVVEGRPSGAVGLANKTEPYDDIDASTLEGLANALALAVEHDRLTTALRTQARIAHGLQRVDLALSRARDVDDLAEMACSAVVDELGYPFASLVTATADGALHHTVERWGEGGGRGAPSLLEGIPCEECQAMSHAMKTGRAVVVDDLARSELVLPCRDPLVGQGLGSMLLVAVPGDLPSPTALLIGAVEVGELGHDFVPPLETFARQLGETWRSLLLRDELLEARTREERALRGKTLFLRNATHELRTPLNAVLGFSGVLAKDKDGTLSKQQRGYVEKIRASGEHLLSMVDTIIELAGKGGSTPAGPSDRVAPAAVVRQAVQEALIRRPRASIEVVEDVSEELPTLAEGARELHRALVIVLDNALEVVPGGGRVTIQGRDVGGSVALTVTDTGPGLERRDLERLFEPFAKVERPGERSSSGAGLGLALARFLLSTRGGEISVESEPGEGAEFTITYPSGVFG